MQDIGLWVVAEIEMKKSKPAREPRRSELPADPWCRFANSHFATWHWPAYLRPPSTEYPECAACEADPGRQPARSVLPRPDKPSGDGGSRGCGPRSLSSRVLCALTLSLVHEFPRWDWPLYGHSRSIFHPSGPSPARP